MDDIVVSKEGVTKLLKGVNPSKALGPDEHHPRVLKELATEMGPVFTHRFHQSLDTGEIPKEWSLANIYWAKVLTDHPKICDNCFVLKYFETNFGTLNENAIWHQSCASADT